MQDFIHFATRSLNKGDGMVYIFMGFLEEKMKHCGKKFAVKRTVEYH